MNAPRRPWPPHSTNDGVLRLTWYLCSHCSQRLKTHPVWRNGCAIDEPDDCTCAGAVLARIDKLLEETRRTRGEPHDKE